MSEPSKEEVSVLSALAEALETAERLVETLHSQRAKRIRRLAAAGATHRVLAEAAGVSRQRVSKIIKGDE